MKKPMLSVIKVIITDEPIGRVALDALQRHRDEDAGQRRHQQVQQHRQRHHPAQRQVVVQQPGKDADHRAPHQAIEHGHADFLDHQPARIGAGVNVAERQTANDQRGGLVARIAADAGDDRHQRRQRGELLDAALERADHARRDEGGAEIDRQPHPAVLRRVPHGGKQVFLFFQAGHRQHVGNRPTRGCSRPPRRP